MQRTRHLGIILSFLCLLAACGGGGGGTNPVTPSPTSVVDPTPTQGPTPTPVPTPTPTPAANEVVISGNVTFDLVPHLSGGGLDYDSTEKFPVRGATVQLVDRLNAVLSVSKTDSEGNYSVIAPMSTSVRIRVLAEVATSAYEYEVIDNTDNDMLYSLAGDLSDSGTADSTRTLNASSGWTGQAYTNTRSAAPFAILDAVYQAMETLLQIDPSLRFDEDSNTNDHITLQLNWSPKNIAISGNNEDGRIGTSFYNGDNKIYILGDAEDGEDTDEYDRGVVQHEFAHFLEDILWRSDNIGGLHRQDSLLDIRVAFGEGFANAFAAIVSETGRYTDSRGPRQSGGFSISLENDSGAEGWYSENSVGEIVYDIYDSGSDNETGDEIGLGFGPIFNVLSSSSYKNNPAFTSIYLFTHELQQQVSAANSQAIETLLSGQNISGSTEWGTGETNDGGDRNNLPVYHEMQYGNTINVCTNNDAGEYNGVDVRRFIRVNIPNTQSTRIRVSQSTGILNGDPGVYIYPPSSMGARQQLRDRSGSYEESVTQRAAGDYIIEVFSELNVDSQDSGGGVACFDVTVTGA